jgi:hypothetical protein
METTVTYQEFLQKLEGLETVFELEEGAIISVSGCPWITVGIKCYADNYPRVNIIDDEEWVTEKIWKAADNVPGHDNQIRKDLLKACKLV